MKPILGLLLSLILGNLPASACECPPVNEETVRRTFRESEIIVIGYATKNISNDIETRTRWNNRNQGYHIIFKIDSVLKGDTTLSEIIVTQLSDGNCLRLFEFGKSMILSGNIITRFMNKTPQIIEPSNGDLPPTELPPPPPAFTSGPTHYLSHADQEEADFWNELAGSNTVISSSLCSSYYTHSEAGSYFLK